MDFIYYYYLGLIIIILAEFSAFLIWRFHKV